MRAVLAVLGVFWTLLAFCGVVTLATMWVIDWTGSEAWGVAFIVAVMSLVLVMAAMAALWLEDR